jgi:Fur family peroxide stress response transcriptional regulator
MNNHMIHTSSRYEQLLASLRQRHYRMTPQRMAMVRLIASSEGHPSAAQLYARIKGQFPSMSLATVYKTLDLLKELGQVLEIDLRDDSHYDGNRPQPHTHLICSKCNKIVDGEADFDPSVIRKLERASGYKILRSQVSFYGLCPDCKYSNQ